MDASRSVLKVLSHDSSRLPPRSVARIGRALREAAEPGDRHVRAGHRALRGVQARRREHEAAGVAGAAQQVIPGESTESEIGT